MSGRDVNVYSSKPFFQYAGIYPMAERAEVYAEWTVEDAEMNFSSLNL